MRANSNRSRRYSGQADKRGISDVLGFTFTFAIILTGVGLISISGFGALDTFVDNQQVTNGDRGMQATASSFDSIQRSGEQYRQVDIVPGSGDIFLNETALTIESDDLNLTTLVEGASEDDAKININALEHRFDDVSVGYESGGVLRTNAADPSYRPSIRCSEEVALVSLVSLSSDETIRESGEFRSDIRLDPQNVPEDSPVNAANQFVSVEANATGTAQVRGDTEDEPVTLNVSETAFSDQWDAYFDTHDDWGWDESNQEATCDSKTAVIRVTQIELSVLEP